MTDAEFFMSNSTHKINYSNTIISPSELRIPSSDLLFENGFRKIQPIVSLDDELPFFFEIPGADFAFDIFGFV